MGVELEIKNKTIAWWELDETSGSFIDEKFSRELEIVGTLAYAIGMVGGNTDSYAVNSDRRVRFPNGDWSLMIWGMFQAYVAGSLEIPLLSKEYYDLSDGYHQAEVLIRYCIYLNVENVEVTIGNHEDVTTWLHPITPVNGAASCLIIRWNAASKILNIQHQTDIANNLMTSEVGAFTHESNHENPLLLFAQDEQGTGAGDHEMYLHRVAIFNGILTDAEAKFLYNSGTGVSYEDLTEEEEARTDDVCAKEIRCCDEDLFAYAVDSSEVVSTARNFLGETPPGVKCQEVVKVTASPEPGLCVRFPIFMSLMADDPDAYILYTLDGSDPARDESGTTLRYTTPIELTNPYVPVRYMPVVTGCENYPIETVGYTDCANLDFVRTCPALADDAVGGRNVWVPDGNDDYTFNLGFDFGTDIFEILRIEVIELDENLQFTTGNAWSTDSEIFPYETQPETGFEAYPLQVDEGGFPIVNAYMDTMGNYTGLHSFDMYGQAIGPAPADHYFKMRLVIVQDGAERMLTAIVAADACGSIPTPCGAPALTLNATCDTNCVFSITVAWNLSLGEAGGAYILRRVKNCPQPSSDYVVVDTGVGLNGMNTFTDENLEANCNYEYWLTYEHPISGCVSNSQNNIQTLRCPDISISVDKAEYESSELAAITVISRYYEAGGPLACPANVAVEYWDGAVWQAWFNVAPNTTVLTNQGLGALPDGSNTIRSVGCNQCGSGSAQVSLIKRPSAPSCLDPNAHPNLKIAEFADRSFPEGVWGVYGCDRNNLPQYDGEITNLSNGLCDWETNGVGVWPVQGEDDIWMQVSVTLQFGVVKVPTCVDADVDAYWLLIYACRADGSGFGLLWAGYKDHGSDPRGTYTFTPTICIGGSLRTPSLAAPATLTVDALA